MLPLEKPFDIPIELLLRFGYREVKCISIDALRKLAQIAITNN
jgi:hypothetical protein